MRQCFFILHRSVAALLLVAGVAAAGPTPNLTTPAGLNPGDKFRFLAVTLGTTDATSADIDTYNAFVQSGAGVNATYGGVAITWKAIGSTATVDARDNVGGFGSLVPIYTPFTGTKLANDMTTNAFGLWSGDFLASPDETAAGILSGAENAWTGSTYDGMGTTLALGSLVSFVVYGVTDSTSVDFFSYSAALSTSAYRMYGLSEELTAAPSAVPEIDPAGMGSVLALVGGGLGMLERRRRRTS